MRPKSYIQQIDIKGFKSIKDQSIPLTAINVFIGANGAGKSNLISFFSLLKLVISNNLQRYVGKSGGADDLLYYSSKNTQEIHCKLAIRLGQSDLIYAFTLTYASRGTLLINKETFLKEKTIIAERHSMSQESDIINEQDFEPIKNVIDKIGYFQFRDASETSRIKQQINLDDNQYLKSDGANLSAYLYMLKQVYPEYYHRIIRYIQMIMPFFDTFILEKEKLNPNKIMLKWKEKNSDLVFYPHQLSDGSLRIMVLITILLLPKDEMPPIIIFDEPEPGVHSSGIEIISSLIKQASLYSQIIIATQSSELLDFFEVDDVVVVNRPEIIIEETNQKISLASEEKQTVYNRLNKNSIEEWLDEYTLSELWAKNVLGGKP
jgi:predicted ATPase